MPRWVPWLVLAAGLAALLYFAVGPGGDPPPVDPLGLEEFGRPGGGGQPGLAPGPGRPPGPEAGPETRPGADDPGPPERPARPALLVKGVVLASPGRRPLPGAEVWLEAAAECGGIPARLRAPADEAFEGPAPRTPLASARADAEGRFELRLEAADPLPALDVYARAEGHVPAVACRVSGERPVEVLLAPGHVLKGRVVAPGSHPVVGVQVYAVPAEATPHTLAHAAHAVSDERGEFTLGAVAAGAVQVVAHHEAYMPYRGPPLDPAVAAWHELVLVPALRLTLHLRSADGRAIENPVVHWRTRGPRPQGDLRLLVARPVGPEGMEHSELECAPVKLPCDAREAELEVKADGCAPWRPSAPLRLPAEGGQEALEAILTRDASLAALHLSFEDATGAPLRYDQLGAVPRITRLDGLAVPSGVRVDAEERLSLRDLPAGPWRVRVHAPGHAPAAAEVELAPGEEREERLALGEPARLKVRFRLGFASETPVRVWFVVLQDGQPVPLFPADGRRDDDTAEGGAVETGDASGGEGRLFTGLGAGAYAIEVRTEGLRPVRREVVLRPGETVEVEVEVERS